MTKEQIAKMQERINKLGKENLVVDGVWGPKSDQACKRYIMSLMPYPSPWPKSDYQSLTGFYGEAGDEDNLVRIEFPYPMFYDGKRVTSTRVHKKCAASLLRVLNRIKDLIPSNPDIKDEAEDFGGIFNNRNKRGGASKSLHAWGAAIDLDADDNTFRDSWPRNSDMPLEICEEFAREGWKSAAVWWSKDAMHHECTRI